MSSGDTVGLVTATIIDTIDPTNQGRVSVQLAGRSDSVWSDVVGAAAASISVGSRVLLGFADDDSDHPFVLGTLQAVPDAAATLPMSNGLTTASGLSVALDDLAQTMTLATPAGLAVTLSDAAGAIRIADAIGTLVVFDSNGISVTSAGTATVSAATVQVTASAVEVDAATATFSGVIRCDTLIANSVVGSAYTPGAGNIQ